ncbi:MAG TPA: HEAT repeat domain-containing protein [Myxococcota bacterium]
MAVKKQVEREKSEPLLQALPEETWRDLFGIAKRADREFGDKLVTALQKIDRGLLPPASTHPYEQHIAAGIDGLAPLVALIETGTAREWFDALDATAHICFALTAGDSDDNKAVPDVVIAKLRAQLKRRDLDPDQLALVVKTLAIARDPGVLSEQLHRLADSDPGVVASAARLLGLGRYKPAARVLRELISPERFYESRAVIWALGELGDPDVLPALYRALAQAFRVVDVAIAIGKIGQLSSVGQLTPLLLSGADEQRDAGYRALAMILDHHRNEAKPLAELFSTLRGLIEAQLNSDMALSGSIRFHMLLCLARMGSPLDAARVRRYLQLGIDDDAVGVAALFTKRR